MRWLRGVVHARREQALRWTTFLAVVSLGVLIFSTGIAVGYEPETRAIDELDGSGVYAGEELRVNLSDSSVNYTTGETVYLVRFTDRPSFTIEETAPIENKTITSEISTDGLETGEQYAFANSTSPSAAGTDGEFSLLDSDFSASWDTDAATGETTSGTIDISSSRTGDYDLTISAEGLDYDDLAALFNDSATISEDRDRIPFERLGYEPAETTTDDVIEDGYITLTGWNTGSNELSANFSALQQAEGLPTAGEYTFEFVVTDTGTSDTSTIDIAERDEDASFSKSLYETAAGDIVTTTIDLQDTESVFIQITDENGFADVVYVDVDDPDKPITLEINTRVLGTDYRSIDGLGGAYDAENVDQLISAYHDGQSFNSNVSGASPFVGTAGTGSPPEFNGKPIFVNKTSTLTYQEYLTQSGYIESGNKRDMLQRPLQPTNYKIEIAGTANVGDKGVFAANKVGPTDRIGRAIIVLSKPTISNISIYQLPGGDASAIDGLSRLPQEKTPASSISHGDRIVVRVGLTGIFGAIAAGGPNQVVDPDRIGESFDTELLSTLAESDNGFEFSIEEINEIGNQKPTAVRLSSDDDATYGVADYSNKSLYLVIDTQSSTAFSKELESEQSEFKIRVAYDANRTDERYRFKEGNPLEGPFSFEGDKANHPYLPAGEKQWETEVFSVGPPRLLYNNAFDDEVHVLKKPETSLNGTTNLRTGTEARAEIVSETNPSNVVVADINIDDENFTTEPFNGSKFANGSAVTIRHVVEGKNIDAERGRIVSEYGGYNDIESLPAERSGSSATESITGSSTSDPDSSGNRGSGNQRNIGVTHLIAVALLSFISGTMIGTKFN
jgi:hypothetical protein